jgi:hypothetical protein
MTVDAKCFKCLINADTRWTSGLLDLLQDGSFFVFFHRRPANNIIYRYADGYTTLLTMYSLGPGEKVFNKGGHPLFFP